MGSAPCSMTAVSLTSSRPRASRPRRLALVTLLQFAEGLSDRQAADAVRSRIDWKYLLGLPLADAGFDSTVLSEFRSRLVAGGAEESLLDAVLEVAAAHRLLKAGGRQRTDSTHVLAAARAMNRIECVHETLRHALEVLALAVPEWLPAQAPPHWAEAYGRRAFDERLPRTAAKRAAWVQQIGEDGHHLLAALAEPAAPDWLRRTGSAGSLPPRCCAAYGSSSSTSATAGYGDARSATASRPRRGSSARPTTPMPITPARAARPGSATRRT